MSLREYPELEQRSEEWYEARCGIVTASVVGNLISSQQPSPIEFGCSDCESVGGDPCVSLRDGKPIKTMHGARSIVAAGAPPRLVTAGTATARNLILTLAAERITGHVEDTYTSFDMQCGRDEEPFARDAYAEHFAPVVELGFMTEDKWGFTIGASPDGLVGTDGAIEIKSRRQKTHVEIVVGGQMPDRHMAQIQTLLLVSGRKWCDYVDFSNGMHLWTQRIYPNLSWFDAITDAVMAAEESIARIVATYDAAVANLPATERIPELDVELKLA